MNFKEIEGFEDYIIYEDGDIYSKFYNKFMKSSINKRKDRPLDKCYYVICLFKNNKIHTKKIHRLLALAFIPNPDNLPCVDHIDRNPQNNAIENLRWASYSTNKLNCGVQKDNQLGEKYIGKTKNNTYRFRIIKYNKYVISEYFKTLEEAIEYRNEWLKKNPQYSL